MFDPALKGYWGADNFEETLETALAVIHDNEAKIDGIKISLLDAQKEVDMRRRLPSGVRMYTGDDFNYPELIKGDAQGYSHALLGIFDPIAIAASTALAALARGDTAEYDRLISPTVPSDASSFERRRDSIRPAWCFLRTSTDIKSTLSCSAGAQSMRPLAVFR